MRTISKFQFTLLILLLLVVIPFSAYATDGQIKIGQTVSTTFPIIISQSGSYVLTSNLTVSTNVDCIQITADNVTLDLNGHSLIGPGIGLTGNGIYSLNKNIAVINGVVQDFLGRGIHIQGANTQVKDIRAYNNGSDGILVGTCSTVTNCMAYLNGGNGIEAYGGADSVISNCTAVNNSLAGIRAFRCSLINCTANYNAIGINARSSTVLNCSAQYNSSRGIFAYNGSIVSNCTALNNTGDGIYAEGDNRIEGNNVRYNGGYGIILQSDENYVIKNSVGNSTSGNFQDNGSGNYMPICGVDLTDNCNYGF